MKTMDYVKAGILKPEALMIGDFIAVAIDDGVEDIVEVLVIDIDKTADNYFIEYRNDFGEKDIVAFSILTSLNKSFRIVGRPAPFVRFVKFKMFVWNLPKFENVSHV